MLGARTPLVPKDTGLQRLVPKVRHLVLIVGRGAALVVVSAWTGLRRTTRKSAARYINRTVAILRSLGRRHAQILLRILLHMLLTGC